MSSETVVLKVKMSCQGCAGAVNRVLEKMEGVESFDIDLKEQKVTVKGNVKPQEVYETISKSGKKTEFWADLENKFTETVTEAEAEPEPEHKSTETATKAELENKVKETATEAKNENKSTEIAQLSEAGVIASVELDNKPSENSIVASTEPENKSSEIDNVVA